MPILLIGRRGLVEEYARTRGQCMVKLFEAVRKNHGATLEQVRRSLGHRRTSVDLAVILSFALLFGFAASFVARRICRLYPLDDGWVGPLVIIVFVSIMGSAAEYCWANNGHSCWRTFELAMAI